MFGKLYQIHQEILAWVRSPCLGNARILRAFFTVTPPLENHWVIHTNILGIPWSPSWVNSPINRFLMITITHKESSWVGSIYLKSISIMTITEHHLKLWIGLKEPRFRFSLIPCHSCSKSLQHDQCNDRATRAMHPAHATNIQTIKLQFREDRICTIYSFIV